MGEDVTAEDRTGTRQWLKRGAPVVVVLAAAGAIAGYVHHQRFGRFIEETNDATIQADQVTISAKLPGYVRRVAVQDNQVVAAGAVLLEIDPTDYRTRLAAADAGIASAVAAEGAAGASRAEALAGIAAAQAHVREAEAGLAHALRETERYRPLVASGAEPASALSQWHANRDRAAAQVAAARAAQTQAQRRVEGIGAQAAQLAAQARSARVQRQAATEELAATRITAPIVGRVAGRAVRAGQYVQPGVRLLTVVPTQDIYVVANFKETQVGLMRPGQPATIRVDALPDVAFSGAVVSVTPGTGANFSLIKPENATGNFTKVVQRVPVRIRINAGPAARRVLVPGLSLEVEVDTRAARGEIDAIREEQERQRP